MNVRIIFALAILVGAISCQQKNSDRFVTVQGKLQHVLDTGKGKPVVIFMHGRGDALTSFRKVQSEIASMTRTFSYDRSGLGGSELIDTARTFENMTTELDQILDSEKIEGPFILVGHSLGCMLAKYYNHTHKGKVIGMILIDPGHEDQLKESLAIRSDADRRFLDSLAHTIDPSWPIGTQGEIRYTDYNDGLSKTIPSLSIPVTVLTSTMWNKQIEEDYLITRADMDIKIRLVNGWVDSVPNAKHILTEKSGHYIHLSEPQLVIDAIQEVLKAADNRI